MHTKAVRLGEIGCEAQGQLVEWFGDMLEDKRLAGRSRMAFAQIKSNRGLCTTYSALNMFSAGSLRSWSTSRCVYTRPEAPTIVDAILMPLREVAHRRML